MFISFVCSLVEATLLTIPKSYLLSIEKDNEWATSFLSFKKNIDKPLSAILTLNTIAHTIGAAGVGAEITRLFGDNYLGFASAILTILILFVSEIIRLDLAAISILVLLGCLSYVPGLEGLVDAKNLFNGYASNAVISIIAVMIIGAGLDKTGLMSQLASTILRYGGKTEKRIIPIISSSVSIISSFMQNVGAAALYLSLIHI